MYYPHYTFELNKHIMYSHSFTMFIQSVKHTYCTQYTPKFCQVNVTNIVSAYKYNNIITRLKSTITVLFITGD